MMKTRASIVPQTSRRGKKQKLTAAEPTEKKKIISVKAKKKSCQRSGNR